MSTYRYLLKLCLSIAFLLNSGCVTVILDNEAVLNRPHPDPVRFEQPVCVKLNFEQDHLDAFNRPEGVQEMQELLRLKYSTALFNYNINFECADPIGEYTVRVSHTTRNWWIRFPWLVGSVLTLGIIPFYIKETGRISIIEDGEALAESVFEEKRLTSIFALPKWVSDSDKAVREYAVDIQGATVVRKEAILLHSVIEKKLLSVSSKD